MQMPCIIILSFFFEKPVIRIRTNAEKGRRYELAIGIATEANSPSNDKSLAKTVVKILEKATLPC